MVPNLNTLTSILGRSAECQADDWFVTQVPGVVRLSRDGRQYHNWAP